MKRWHLSRLMFSAVVGVLLFTASKGGVSLPSNNGANSLLIAQQPGITTADQKFEAARKLAGLGYYTEAQEELKKAIKEHPNTPVPDDLKYLSGGKIPFWRNLTHQFEPWGQPIVEIFEIIFVLVETIFVLVIVILLIRVVRRWVKESNKLRLDIQDFENGGTAPEIGRGLAAMIEEQLNNIDSQGGILLPQLVAGPIEKLQLPINDISSVAPSLRIFSLFTDMLTRLPFLYRNTYTLLGYIQPPSAHGVGITLILKKQTANIVANCTIWQKDYEPTMHAELENSKHPELYYCLAEPAAIWSLFQLQEVIELDSQSCLSINNWKSYAFFRSGVYWRQHGKNENAKIMFVQAIEQDQNNHFALCNLGIITTEAGDYDRAIERLQRAKDIAEEQKKENIFKEPVWYKAKYQLAATYLYKGNLFRAELEAKQLITEINNAINYLQCLQQQKNGSHNNKATGCIQDKENKVCLKFLNSFKPMALILYAHTLASSNKLVEAEDNLREIEQPISYRAHYNLACYYCGISQYEQALRHLEYAFEPSDQLLWDWSEQDPSLKKVREDESMKDKFKELHQKYNPKQQKTTTSKGAKDNSSASESHRAESLMCDRFIY